MPPLMQLPGYQIKNALVDFAPVNQGLDTYRKGMVANQDYKTAQSVAEEMKAKNYNGAMGNALMGDRADLAGLAMHAQSNESQMKSAALDREHKMAQMYGGVAQRILESKDPAEQQAMWQRVVKSHPEFASRLQEYGVDPNDHLTGSKFLMAQAAGYRNPLDDKLKQAQIHAAYRKDEPDVVRTMRAAGIDPKSAEGQQLLRNSIKGGSPIDQMIAKMMDPSQQPQQPLPQRGGIVPQSFNPEQGPDAGGIVRVDQPMPPQVPMSQPEPMVQTPMGQMPKSQADKLGFALALSGKGDAGKMLTGADALGKEAQNQNDKAALNSIEQASRLDSIMTKFKPEYQTLDYKLNNAVNSTLDSFGPTRGMVRPEDRQKMAEYTQFRQDSMNNLSAYIKEITGAAMGIQEEKRIRAGMPDPEKDSPVEFEAKMRNSIATAKLALARHAFLKRNGYDDGSIAALAKSDKLGSVHSLDDMKSIINQRMGQAADQIKQRNPNISDMDLKNQLRGIQRKEFGI